MAEVAKKEPSEVLFDTSVSVLKGLRSETNRVRKMIGELEDPDIEDLTKHYKVLSALTERFANILEQLKGV